MDKILTPILFGVAASALLMFTGLINRIGFGELINQLKSGDFINQLNISDLINRFKAAASPKKKPKPSIEFSPELDLTILNCRVTLSEYQDDDSVSDAFDVEMCGSIHTRRDVQSATLKISIMDTTDPEPNTYPVQSPVKQWQVPDSAVFCYKAGLGKLPNQVTTIADWTSIALLRLDWLELPRKGERELKFEPSIFPDAGGERIAHASCIFNFHNPDFGYLDSKETIQRSKTLAIALAFSVSAVDEKLLSGQITLVIK